MKMKAMGAIAVAAFLTAGCAAIDFSETSGNLDAFNPKSVAILPFTNSIGIEAANETCNSLLAQQIVKRGFFARVAEPGQVKAAMMSNDALLNAITAYRSKWVATGMSDGAQAAAICRALGVESIMFGEISNWGKQSAGLDKYYRVGINLRWVEATKGEILWKASHTVEQKVSFLGGMVSDGQKDVAGTVVNMIMNVYPKKKG